MFTERTGNNSLNSTFQLVRKAYSLSTHDNKNTKLAEILMMAQTPQLRKIPKKIESSTSIINSRTRHRFSKFSR